MVFTKIDKLSSTALQKNLAKYKKEMLKYWEELPPVFTSSSDSGFGKEPLLNYIEQILAWANSFWIFLLNSLFLPQKDNKNGKSVWIP